MSQYAAQEGPKLSKYPVAGFRELLFLSAPLILGLVSSSLMGFCDRLFLARFSTDAWSGSVVASNLIWVFQHPLMRIASMTQIFVGLYYGAGKRHQIGPAVWQMIWFCLFSILFTFPLSKIIAPYFFQGAPIEGHASVYFSTIMLVNFLFPIGTTLSVFFIGQGRMKIVLLTTIVSHGLNIGLDYFLIFGLEGVFPPCGVLGAAIATAVSQFLFCIILLGSFLRKSECEEYRTNQYAFNLELFWKQFRVGAPRALARLIVLCAWVAVSRLMTLKGGDYLLVLSTGSTLILLFTFIHDGVLQGMVTIASNIRGRGDVHNLKKLVQSAFILLALTAALIAVPHLLAPDLMLSFFFSEPLSPATMEVLRKTCVCLWIFFICYGCNNIGLSLILAARDMTFYLLIVPFVWLTSFVPIYFGMNVWNWGPHHLWSVMAFDSLVFGVVSLYRSLHAKGGQKAKALSL